MAERVTLTATVRVERPLDQAMHLFTPVGEREWADGWDPGFPAGELGDGAAQGTVFLTGGPDPGETTFWTAAERRFDLVRYARVTPDRWAGTVEVHGTREGAALTIARVTYDLTALSSEGAEALDEFAAAYDEYIAGWEREIAAAISRTRPPATP